MSKTLKDKSMDTFYDYPRGRWMCPTDGDAYTAIEEHQGDPVWRFDRDTDGNIINERPFWTPRMKDTHKLPVVRHGRLGKKTTL